MRGRRYHWFLLAGALVFLGAALAIRRPWSRPSAPPIEPLAIIPAGAAFVLDIDLARLRTTKVGNELSELGWTRFSPGRATWEFQPLRDVDEIVVVVPESAALARERKVWFEPDAVAVVAVGRFTGRAAADAAVESIRARGGEPSRTTLGSFESVRDFRGNGEVAARDGLVVLSDGAYLRAVLAAAEGQKRDGSESERTRDRVHSELRRVFGHGAPITATLTLPEGWLEAALGDPDVHRSPLALVRSAALRVNVNEKLDLYGLLVCASTDDCARVAKFMVDLHGDVERELGSNAALRRWFEVGKQDKERLSFSLSLSLEDVRHYLAPPAASAR